MKNIWRIVLEINYAAYPWCAGIAAIALAAQWFSGDSYRGASPRAIGWFMAASTVCALIYKQELAARPIARARAAFAATDTWRMLPVYGGWCAYVLWMLAGNDAARGIITVFTEAGAPAYAGVMILGLTFGCIAYISMRDIERMEDGLPEPTTGWIKETYRAQHECAASARAGSAFPLRAYAHRAEYESIANYITAGETVLDNGCGDGGLAVLLAQRGARVTACDISPENIRRVQERARHAGVLANCAAIVADAEALPFPDNSFDWVVSCHVLEHVPDFTKGLAEVRRVTKKRAIIALPTCLNPCAAVILGGDSFWALSRMSPFAWFIGGMRIALNMGGIGVNEGYRGNKRLPHVWRYPWVMRRELRASGLAITSFQASSLCLPYASRLLPLIKKLERYRAKPIIRNFGYGSIAVVEK
jgi:SAM-dependent methyltransferase